MLAIILSWVSICWMGCIVEYLRDMAVGVRLDQHHAEINPELPELLCRTVPNNSVAGGLPFVRIQ